ncbi:MULTISPECIES: SRPBCC family protein [unclassified Acinetobacter]|uniref:SRPBCC family protein n=1 Tax=unclassified Acinetobacter TaxID=196816 RepID=UPI0022AC887D|nr:MULTISPECIES: SRPBCC family protein [unclassified Acinetobacter]WAU73971.1 SRPBCC family protein [Acinetobacter sp. TR11]WAU76256.1 SRPBCC family protein [Acinetobacter sp. TR3]
MFYLNGFICTAVFFSIMQSCFAQIITWNDNIPSALQPFQNNPQLLASYTQNNIFIYPHPNTKTNVPTLKSNSQPSVSFTSAALIVPANVQQVAKTLTDFNQYVGLFPTLKSAKTLEQSGNIIKMKYQVSIPTPIPVLNFNEDVTLQHQIKSNSIASLVIDSPIPYGVGKFEWFALDDHRTLITLTQWGDLNQPKGFIFKKILNAIPEAKLGIPSSTNAFILESLRTRFIKPNIVALNSGQIPSPQLNETQLAKIAQLSQNTQQPISYLHVPTSILYTHGRETMRFTTTYQFYQQPPQLLHKWLSPLAYKELFPRQVKKIITSPIQNQGQDADIQVNVGLGVINIPFAFKLHFNYPNTVENNFYANGGDLRFIKGKMIATELNQGTLFKITSSMKIDEKAPFLLRAMRSLPYHDVLPAVGGNTVFVQKIKTKI